jgi:hypothetical protein
LRDAGSLFFIERNAARKAQDMVEKEMSKFTGGLNIPGLGGLL